MLEDRCSMVILVREAIHQQKFSGIQRPPSATRRRDQEERPCGSGYGPESGTPFALLTYVFNEINAVTRAPARTEGSVAVKEMLKLQTAQLDEFFVRLQAKHDKPREGRPWVWSLMLAEVVPPELRAAVQAVARLSKENRAGLPKGIQIAPQHSQDGNIVKNILKGPQKQEDDWEMDGDGDGENDDGGRNGQKRGRR